MFAALAWRRRWAIIGPMLLHPKGPKAMAAAGVAVTVLAVGGAVAWSLRAPPWYAVVYDNVANRAVYEVIARTPTLQQCGDALRNEFAERRLWGAGGPEVGWECHTDCIVHADRTLDCARIERGLDTLR
jgi:hypothetical protein